MRLRAVQDYYGSTLSGTSDLRTDACTSLEAPPPHVAAALADVHRDVRARYYGCGLVAPEALEGARVLDLGSGAGQDVYVLAKLVGERGAVVGVDATPAQLEVARAHQAWHAERHGYAASNVSFLEGDIGALDRLDLEPESFDVVVSNCVFNLVADKAAVFRAAHRLLKPGGEIYFADVYADRRLPPELARDPVILGECLGGALYWSDFRAIAADAGFPDPRCVTERPLAVRDAAVAEAIAPARFAAATFRLFKIAGLEPGREDYGQVVRYRGGIAGAEEAFTLDARTRFARGVEAHVCGNVWRMLTETRFAPFFDVVSEGGAHQGPFEPFPPLTAWSGDGAEAGGGCCG
ncbi:MAG: methyltransferase domain-containing protein [Caulobacterales bacterium]|nr:methyltransferase domain-containing protein [Caulobacterales bacterium]